MQLLSEIWKNLAKKTGGLLWVIAASTIMLFSLALLIVGHFLRTPPTVVFPSAMWFGDLAWGLGTLSLTGGIVAVFIRMLHSINFLEDALNRVMWSTEFLSKRNDIDDLWARLAVFRYRRFSNLHEKEQSEFFDRLTSAFRAVIGREEEQMIRDHRRIIDINWRDEANRIIQITERQTYKVIPSSTAKFTITTTISTGGKLKMRDYKVIKDDIFLKSVDIRQPIDLKREKLHDRVVTTYELSGASTYDIIRDRIVSWAVDNDPIFSVTSRHVCDGFTLEVNCKEKNIETRFRQNGIRKCFKDEMAEDQKKERPGDQRQTCTDTLLPGDGFSLYFQITS